MLIFQAPFALGNLTIEMTFDEHIHIIIGRHPNRLCFTNHLWNGVTTLYLAEIIETILTESLFETGVFHVFSNETLTKYELVKLISDAYGLDVTVNPHPAGTACDRSLATVSELNGIVMRKSIQDQVREMKEFFSSTR